MRRLTAATLLVIVVTAVGCGGEGGGAGPADEALNVPLGPPTKPVFGYSDNSVRAGLVSAPREAALARRAGARVVRLTFDWRFAERAPGRYDFSAYDRIYDALLGRGIRPLWTVVFAPPWAWDEGTSCNGDCRFPPARESEDDYGRMLARIARRYPRSAGIEVWNEPNLTTFWQPRPNSRRYTRLLRVSHAAVKRVAPAMKVIGGALSNNMHDHDGNISMGHFLGDMYAGGAARSMDALSFHPYSVSRKDPLMLRSVGVVLKARQDARDSRTPMWITELGATTSGEDSDLRFTERQQADVLRDDFCRLARVPGVRLVLVHTLLAPPGPDSSGEPGYGVLRPDGTARPAVRSLVRASRGGC